MARALGAASVSLLALLADPDAAYLVADSSEREVGCGSARRWAQYPHASPRASSWGRRRPSPAPAKAPPAATAARVARRVFPVLIGRKPAGILIARFEGECSPPGADASVGAGAGAAVLGTVLRGAKALEPLRERTRRVTLPDVREERRVRAIERYRAFIDSASDGIVVVDAAGVVLYLNRAAEEVTGYARDGLSGKPITKIVPEPFRASA